MLLLAAIPFFAISRWYPIARRSEPKPRPSPATKRIILKELTFGTKNSDSVRLLQHRLNGITLKGGVELPVTGNYLEMTRDEVIKWQIQKRHHKPENKFADGNIHPRQAKILFGKKFEIVE